MLADYQKSFIEFAISHNVLQFGDFTLKSGRISPYFFNAGLFNTGDALRRLGEFYAAALRASGLDCELLFGPAYKGIPLVAATSIALSAKHDIVMPYVFNRKEIKAHGEGGSLVGAELNGRTVIVDDVITAGTAIREVMDILAPTSAKAIGVLVAIDRQEKGQGQYSAIQEVEQEYNVMVVSVVKLAHIIEYLQAEKSFSKELALIEDYRIKYGIES